MEVSTRADSETTVGSITASFGTASNPFDSLLEAAQKQTTIQQPRQAMLPTAANLFFDGTASDLAFAHRSSGSTPVLEESHAPFSTLRREKLLPDALQGGKQDMKAEADRGQVKRNSAEDPYVSLYSATHTLGALNDVLPTRY